jgi:SHS2 domain-containing protein
VPYRFLDDVAPADVAFEATGDDLASLFEAAWEATLSVMVEPVDTVLPREAKDLRLEAPGAEALLYDTLAYQIYLKDAEGLLLRLADVRVVEDEKGVLLVARAAGEPPDPQRHSLGVDVKAVTYHRFGLSRSGDLWRATVVLDV